MAAESNPDVLLLSGKFIKESNLSKSDAWKSRTFELWSSGLLTYKNRVGFCDERNIKDAAFRIIEKKVPLAGKKSVIIKALEIKTANRKLTIAFHAESVEKNITHLEGFKKVIKENFHRDFLEDEPLSNDLPAFEGKTHLVDSDDDSDDDNPAAPTSTSPATVPSSSSSSSTTQVPPSTTVRDSSSTTPPPSSSSSSSSTVATPTTTSATSTGLDFLKGNKDGIILGVVFGVFAFLLVILDFLLKKL